MRAGFRSVGVSPTPLRGTGWKLVQRGTDSHVRASVSEDSDATAWTRLSKPQVLGRDADATPVARTVVSVLTLGQDCPSHGCLGETPKPRVACVQLFGSRRRALFAYQRLQPSRLQVSPSALSGSVTRYN
ncbi:MAG: hypothetical protein NZ874_04565 [Fimbriimonadales bacterium]|nr:hypothetical protein [Fimbriimonadales bacterium]